MIINFSVQNFGSIKDKQVLSFEADKSTHLEDYYVIKTVGGLRLLKMAMIFGANASGKTTVLKALDFLRQLVLHPLEKKTDDFDFQPFLFDASTPTEDSVMSIGFIQNDIRYHYEVAFNKNAISREELYSFHPNKAVVYKRTTDMQKQLTNIAFGSKIKVDKASEKSLEANTLWNNTVLGGFLKTNIELNELKEATDWFGNYLKRLIFTKTELESNVSALIQQAEISKEVVVNILQKADLNISNIIVKESVEEIPNGFLELAGLQFKSPSEQINQVQIKKKITTLNLEFEHTVGEVKYALPFELESEGTKRYYGFAGLLSLLIRGSAAIPIDELEGSLHPDLYLHFILSFLVNSKRSQIIATTHNRELLNNKDIFRNDAIWFADKSTASATELYALSDFDSSVIRDTSNILNAYKSGRLGGTPNLGDYFIDIDHED